MNPLISVIIPVYNVESYLKQCVESVIDQSFKNIEIILVDDGSTDKSPTMCDEFALLDSRIKVIHKDNGGSSDARNVGIKEAQGKFLMFLDSDDYWSDHNCLSEIVLKIEANPNVDVVMFNMSKLDNESGKLEKNLAEYDLEKIKSINIFDCLNYLVENDLYIASSCNKVVKRDIILDNNLFFLNGFVGEDIDWSARLMLFVKKFDAINNPFYIYRKQRENSVSNVKSVNWKKIDNVLTIIENCLIYINKQHLDQKLFDAYMGFLAYQYSTVIGLIGLLKGNKRDLIVRMKKIKDILNYDINYKVRKVKFLYRLVGFTFTTIILGKYISSKQN